MKIKMCTYGLNEHNMRKKESSFDVGLAQALAILNPKSVLDLGCGPCWYADHLRSKNIPTTTVDYLAVPNETAPDIIWDLNVPLRLDRKYDLVLCLEMAQCIEEENLKRLIESCTRHSSRLIVFSAAQPGQGSPCALSLLPFDEYLVLFGFKGFVLNPGETERLRSLCSLSWFRSNLLFLEE